MFRKVYKEANDCIHGDRAILERAFEMAEMPEKKQSNILKYSFIGTAAAAVITAGAVFMNYGLFKSPIEDIAVPEPTETVSEEAADEIEYIDSQKQAEDSVGESEGEPLESKIKSAPKAEKSTSEPKTASGEMNNSEAQIEVEDTREDADAYDESSASAKTSEPAAAYGKNRSADDYTGSANEIAVMSMIDDEIDEAVTICTQQEYFDYIGIDMSKLILPEDLSFDMPERYSLTLDENGEIAYDTALFNAFKDGREITVITSKLDDVQWALDMYERVGENISVMDDGAFLTVYAIKGDVSLTVVFQNITDEEMTDFITRLMK